MSFGAVVGCADRYPGFFNPLPFGRAVFATESMIMLQPSRVIACRLQTVSAAVPMGLDVCRLQELLCKRGKPVSSVNVVDLTLEELKRALDAERAMVIDVREEDEFAGGRIPGSLNFPLSTFDAASLPAASDRQIVVTCRSGQRSRVALQMAHAAGRTDLAAHFPGGMLEWIGSGGPVER